MILVIFIKFHRGTLDIDLTEFCKITKFCNFSSFSEFSDFSEVNLPLLTPEDLKGESSSAHTRGPERRPENQILHRNRQFWDFHGNF